MCHKDIGEIHHSDPVGYDFTESSGRGADARTRSDVPHTLPVNEYKNY
jgi:hypothetical protein